ncbi:MULTISPECIES: hypothetical protein [Halorubrum]|uniref:hypothetical protein n=1 Tax=Halorubrum TaxID=56688 RepID=UPI000AAB8D2D|nr:MULTISPECIES: hypothetical protein [Halorubrum]
MVEYTDAAVTPRNGGTYRAERVAILDSGWVEITRHGSTEVYPPHEISVIDPE